MIKFISKAKNKASKLLNQILKKEEEVKFDLQKIKKENWDVISEIPLKKNNIGDYYYHKEGVTDYYEELLKKISYTKHSKKKEKLIKKKKRYEELFKIFYENN